VAKFFSTVVMTPSGQHFNQGYIFSHVQCGGYVFAG
jgi:hypothetical protein